MNYELLKNAGIDTDTALGRFMGNKALLERFLKKFLEDKNFERLQRAVDEGDHAAALEASHTLKGVCGNLSLDELYELFSGQVSLMREDRWEEAADMMERITAVYDRVTEAIRNA